MLRSIFAAMICLAAGASAARADGDWRLTDSQLHSVSALVDAVDDAGVHLAADNLPAEVVAWDQVLELSRTRPKSTTTGLFVLDLRGGDQLSGIPTGLDGDQLQWHDLMLGDIHIPLSRLAALERDTAAPAGLLDERTDDVVHLANGDVAHGIVASISADGVGLQTGGATASLTWNAIDAVLFSTPPAGPPSMPHRRFRVHLGGEAVTVSAIEISGNSARLALEGDATHTINSAEVWDIEQLDGPVSWLSGRVPSQSIYRPFFDESFPPRFDMTVDGRNTIAERFPEFHHGIGCHSYTRLTYDLDGGYPYFQTQWAIDSDSPLADVTVRIGLDDKVVLERKNVKAGPPAPVARIALGSAKALWLEVDYGENYATEDRFAWLDPALVRAAPATIPTTAPTTVP